MSEAAEPSSEPVRNSTAQFGTVKEAAVLHGISERAVLKRVSAGTLEALREGKQWRVKLPDAAPSTEPSSDQNGPGAEPTALVETLQSEIQFLRGRVEKHETAESELRRLLLSRDMEIARLSAENRKLLAAPVEEPTQDAQEVVPVPTGDTEQAGSVPEPVQRRRAWWEVWRR